MTTRVLRALMVEDSEDDAILVQEALSSAGYDVRAVRVDTEEGLRRALGDAPWDIVLTDYSMPSFDAQGALRVVEETGYDIPVIVISGTVGEEVAVETLKLGAEDYLLKQNLTRLVPAVARALDVAESRRQHRKAERMKTLILERSFDLICTVDVQGHFLEVNPASKPVLGYEPSELTGVHFAQLVHPDELALIQREFQTVVRGSPVRDLECRFIHKSGQAVYLTWSGMLSEADGVILGVARDITERKQNDEALRRVEDNIRRERALLRALIDSIPDLIFFKDRNFVFRGCNRAFENYLGIAERELIGKTDFDIVPEEWARYYRSQDQKLFVSDESQRVEEQIPGTGGRTGTFDTIKTAFYGPDGESLGLVGISRDISERKRMEEALRKETAMFEAQVESSLDGILVVDRHGKKVIHNQRLSELLKIPSDLAGNPDDAPLLEFVTGRVKAPAEFAARVAWLYAHREAVGRDVVELLDGTILDRYSAPVLDKDGRYYGRIWTFRDITEQRRAEEQQAALEAQLRQNQKLEALGTLAGGIAHDFNNILTAIIVNHELALMDLYEPEVLRRPLDEIGQASKRAKELVRQILTFSRRQKPERRREPLQLIVDEVLSLVRATLPATIELRQHLAPDTPPVLADAGQIHQVVMNLCTNAAHAMGDRPGRLTVQLAHRRLDEAAVQAFSDLPPGDYAQLTITDTGRGMEPEVLGRIFEPFFTTKGPGEGTGLGLAVVHGIVKDHEGGIAVHSKPDAGTTFELYFPKAVEADAPVQAADTSILAGRGECILFVDDEEAIRQAVGAMLRKIGYRVETFADPRTALERLRTTPEAFDLLLTDRTMPHLSGPELVAQARASRPRLPALVMSGLNSPSADDQTARGEYGLLAKPIDIAELSHAVRRALDAGIR